MNQTQEILNGLLLGDGTLEPYKDISARLQVRRRMAHSDYNSWIVNNTQELKWGEPTTLHLSGVKIKDRILVDSIQQNIRTARSKALLLDLHRKWYTPTKRIPENLVLTPLTLAVWYMDDGSISFSKQKSGNTTSASIHLHTCGFSENDCAMLQSMLLNQHGIKSSLSLPRKVITLGGRIQTSKFITIVKPFVAQVDCMKYKILLDKMTPLKDFA